MKTRIPNSELITLGLTWVLLVALFSVLSRHFLSAGTFSTIANQIPALAVVSTGMTFVIITAGIDLSVGSVLALSGAVLGVVMKDAEQSLFLSVLACLMAGSLCGLINGGITVTWAVPSFIVTLGMLEMARGGAYWITGSQTRYLGTEITGFSSPLPWIRISPAFLIAIVIVVAGHVLLTRTAFGRRVFAVGGNEEAAWLSGIRPGRIKLIVFSLAGLMAGLGAVFTVSHLGSVDPNAREGFELKAIAAVVIGGTSLMGGRGSVIATFFGVLIIATLESGLNHLGAPEYAKRIITGAVIILAVIVDSLRHRVPGGPLAILTRWFQRTSAP